MDLVSTIYHEKQEPGSQLCAQHALNNLLQSSLFTPQDLADIARQLDILEAEQLDEVPGGSEVEESPNYDDSGFFSIMVMEEALKVLGLKLVRWHSKEMKDVHDTPERMEGFVLNHQLHWYTIRRFATPQRFYNLDSCIPSPTWISPTFLGLTLREAENQGYSIFVVLPTEESAISGLPSSEAADRAATLPPPSTTMRTSDGSAARFSDVGHTLGSSQDKGNLKRGADFEEMDEGESGSSVEGESEKRRRRPRWETASLGEELSEEEQIAQAIAMSLAASKAREESDDEIIIVEPKDANGKGKGKGKGKEVKAERKEEKPTKMKLKRRGEDDEDAELAAAMKASLEVHDSKPGNEEEEEDDSPSVEELRRRRLARFGG